MKKTELEQSKEAAKTEARMCMKTRFQNFILHIGKGSSVFPMPRWGHGWGAIMTFNLKEGNTMNSIDNCNRQQSCTANICFLDGSISDRTYLKGERVCPYVLDFLEGKPTPFDAEIRGTELIWKAKYGEGNLQRRLKSRQSLREAFKHVLKGNIPEDVQAAI